MLGRGTSTQIGIGIMIAFVYAKAHEATLPYCSTSLGKRKIFSLWQVVIVLVLALLVKAEFSDDNLTFIIIIIILGVCSNLIMDCYNLAVVFWINRKTSIRDIFLTSASNHVERSKSKTIETVVSPLSGSPAGNMEARFSIRRSSERSEAKGSITSVDDNSQL